MHFKTALFCARIALLVAPVLTISATAAAQTKGMVALDDHRVTIFNADTNTVVTTLVLPDGAGVTGDCSISADGTRGFVTDFTGKLHVINLTTNTLAGPPNPVPITNAGEDTSITPDGKYVVVCDGSGGDAITRRVSVVDIATQTQVSTFDLGTDCNSVDVCSDSSVLVTSNDAGEVRRLTINGAGTLSDTGDSLDVTDPNNVACAPGAQTGIVVTRSGGEVQSFTIPGLAPVDTRTVPTGYAIGVVISGNAAYTRSAYIGPKLQGWSYDPVTGDLGAAAFFTNSIADTSTYFGMDQLGIHPTTGNVYLPQPFALNRYNRNTGAFIGSMALPSGVPTGVCFQPTSTCATVQRGVFGNVQDSDLNADNGDWPAGAFPYIWTGFSPRVHRALLRFGLNFIPAGAYVTSADVSLNEQWNTYVNPIRVHEVLNPWNEATVTWTNFNSLANFSPTVIASFLGGGVGTKTFDITPLAAAWVNGSADNNGILLEEPFLPGGTLHAFAASEWSVVSSRPKLDICYAF